MNFCFMLLCGVVSAAYIGSAVSFKLLRTKRTTDEVPTRCLLPPETGPCMANFLKYHYNTTSGECEEFVYGGCQGNDNSFWAKSDCEAVCKGTTIDAEDDNLLSDLLQSMEPLIEAKDDCEYPPETGDCRALFRRYYFNGENCERFAYGGCGGNPNNFLSEEECMKRCGPESETESVATELDENTV